MIELRQQAIRGGRDYKRGFAAQSYRVKLCAIIKTVILSGCRRKGSKRVCCSFN